MSDNNFLYEKIYDEIYTQIISQEYKPGDILPAEKTLSDKMQVSLITIRRALQELESEGLVNKMRGKGTFVSDDVDIHKKTDIANKTIGILYVPYNEIVNSNYPEIYEYQGKWPNGIYKALFNQLSDKYNIIIDGYSIDKIINDFDNTIFSQTDRILVLGEYTSKLIEFLHEKDKLVVVYNNFEDNNDVASVNNNEREICKKSVEYLIDKGHTKIGAINGITGFSESVERYMGFQKALIENNISINTDYIKWGNMEAESGYFLMKEILTGDEHPTAVFCVNDGVAIGAISAIQEKGLKCPEDISIISHDNSDEGRDYVPKLTSIDPKFDMVGKQIAEKMQRDIWIDDVTVVESEIIYRDSVCEISK